MLSVIAAPLTFLDDQVGPRYPPAGKAFVRTGIFGWNFPGHASGVGGPDRGQGRGYRLGSPPAPADREDRGAPTGLTAGLPILGPGLTMGVGRLSTEVTMAIEREMDGAYLRLAEAAAAMRYRQRHYLDGRGGGMLFGPATALTAAHPWALADFGTPAWADFRPDPQAPPPDGLRVGVLRLGEGVPPVPAVARFAGHGHLLISERGFADGARSLLQALTLRLATATRPGTVRFALADPVGQGRYLSAFLRLPAQLRVGAAGGLRVGVAASPAETEALLTTLTSHVVEVTQTRLTNVYDSVETYNAATTGATVPYHVLVLAGFPAGISDRAGELLGRLARNGPRSGLYIVATVDPWLDLPRGFDLAGLTALGTTVSLDEHGDLGWDDPDFAGSVIEPDQMPGAAQANPWLDAVGAAAGSAYRDLPFGRIAVPPTRRWAGNTTDGLDVQIGVDSKGEP